MRPLSLKAPAKLNLFLVVLNRRPDGYHNIETLFERINLCDDITFQPRQDSNIIISSTDQRLPKGKGNLCYQAALILKTRFSLKHGVNIHIQKNIPIGAGLGGGSSDAATTLLALNQLWKLKLAKSSLCQIASGIGSDVPFFVRGDSFSLARRRGEKLQRLMLDIGFWHILAVPNLILSTRKVYKRFDSLKIATPKRTLTHSAPHEIARARSVSILREKDLEAKGRCISSGNFKGLTKQAKGVNISGYNSLEPAAVSLLPQIDKIKQALYSYGLKNVGMSGSGPSVFGILRSRKEGVGLKRKLARFKDWRTFIVRTL